MQAEARARAGRARLVSPALDRKLGWMRPLVHRLLRLRMWLAERFRPGEGLVTLMWAGLVGCIGGFSGPAFRGAAEIVQHLFTGNEKTLVEAATDLPIWRRLLVPAVGGLLAGLVLTLGARLVRGRRSTDYMEAIVLGEGVIRTRPTLVKIASSILSIASGGSIGREGPMVQLAAMLASLCGRFARFPRPRMRLMVACGAAAGIASAYNAPIGGALFVAEIVLGSIAMQSFGPLLLSSVMATVIARALHGSAPLFEAQTFHLVSAFELLPYLLLGLFTGASAPLFLKLLEQSALFFSKWKTPVYVRMCAGGLIVGVLSIKHPYVWGNGYDALSLILTADWVWTALLTLLLFKLVATASTVGSGAVGGVFTPTLLVGAVIGSLVGTPVHAAFPTLTAGPQAYALVGMGAFLAATTHAPLMAILILFDMTLNHEIVLPLMVACVSAYTAANALQKDSIYAAALRHRDVDTAPTALESLRVRDLMRPDPPCVSETAPFSEIVQTFARNRHHNLYVVGLGRRFRGVIPLHEIKPYLNNEALANIAIAEDLVREEFPTVTPDTHLYETLEKFRNHSGERLPVIDAHGDALVGSISKTDLLLTLAHGAKANGTRS